MSAVRSALADGRWHFQHGPIDCIVAAEGRGSAAAERIERAWERFRTVLDELVAELPLLRADLSSPRGASVVPLGPVARRMVAACRPHAAGGRFITPMAAVAGSVAEELIAAFADERIARASVNNGGDIALRLAPGESYGIGLVADVDKATLRPACFDALPLQLDGHFTVDAASGVRGIATSGWRGRSFSLGIADSVTVLAATASVADAAATIVANAVDVADACIVRVPADSVRDDSDLGHLLVTRHVPALPLPLVAEALDRGVAVAETQISAGRIMAAVLSLQGHFRICGDLCRRTRPFERREVTAIAPRPALALR